MNKYISQKKKNASGFTLIELLLVIAVIALLSSIVMANLTSARTKSLDVTIRQSLGSLRNQSALFLTNQGTYTGFCTNATTRGIIKPAENAAGLTLAMIIVNATPGNPTQAVCHVTTTAWAIGIPLKSDNTKSWCVDSAGNSKQINGYLPGSIYVCP